MTGLTWVQHTVNDHTHIMKEWSIAILQSIKRLFDDSKISASEVESVSLYFFTSMKRPRKLFFFLVVI